MSDINSMDPLRQVHPMWRVHLFFACILAVVGFVCIMTGALIPFGIPVIVVAVLWGVGAVLVGMYQQHHDRVAPPDVRQEYTNMDID
jgi:uncharacterized membrane protein